MPRLLRGVRHDARHIVVAGPKLTIGLVSVGSSLSTSAVPSHVASAQLWSRCNDERTARRPEASQARFGSLALLEAAKEDVEAHDPSPGRTPSFPATGRRPPQPLPYGGRDIGVRMSIP